MFFSSNNNDWKLPEFWYIILPPVKTEAKSKVRTQGAQVHQSSTSWIGAATGNLGWLINPQTPGSFLIPLHFYKGQERTPLSSTAKCIHSCFQDHWKPYHHSSLTQILFPWICYSFLMECRLTLMRWRILFSFLFNWIDLTLASTIGRVWAVTPHQELTGKNIPDDSKSSWPTACHPATFKTTQSYLKERSDWQI